MKTRNIGILAALFSVVAVTSSRSAHADDAPLPAETLKAQTVTKGNTEVAKGGFAAAAPLPTDEDPREATEASLGAGGLFSSGNARQVAVTSLGKLRLRRDEHQFTTLFSANFARAGKKGEKRPPALSNETLGLPPATWISTCRLGFPPFARARQIRAERRRPQHARRSRQRPKRERLVSRGRGR